MTSFAALLGALFGTLTAFAAPAFAPPGNAQPGLAVGSDEKGVLRAKLCAAEPCDVNGGLELDVPAELKGRVPQARLAIVGIGSGRRAIVVTVSGARDGRAYEALVVAPAAGTAPKLLFSGLTGVIEGPDGVRQGKVVSISEPGEDGARRIVVGLAREDLDLCGRPAVLAPELLNPRDLALRPARVQRLSISEREGAVKLAATKVEDDAPPSSGGVLRALGASSAIGAPSALTDGRPETSWAENRGGAGRGEFVVLGAPPELPLTGFELIVVPKAAQTPRWSVPRELWLVTRKQVFAVTLPDEAPRLPGARYRVTLPRAVQTDCVALVTETAFEERADSQVGVAELAAVTELSGADATALTGALAGGGERAEAAGALLRGMGAPGFEAIANNFERLDEGGRRVALDTIDAAACELKAPVYVTALTGTFPEQRAHAADRLRGCGAVSGRLLAERFATATGKTAILIADELSLIAPSRAVDLITPRISKVNSRERRAFRIVLARAAASNEARPSVERLLLDPGLSSLAGLELLRALGPRLPSFLPTASGVLARVGALPDFRSRYLALAPAGLLAARDPNARGLLQRALADRSDPRLRVRALEVMPTDGTAVSGVLAALSDENVRVREAAANAAREGRLAAGAPTLVRLLRDDSWPLVRRAAAEALAALPQNPQADDALLTALEDEAPWVRAAAASALGERRVARAAKALRERLSDREERLEVRRAAAASAALLCDAESLDALTELTRKLGDPLATVEERALAEAALDSLSRIAPKDLASRLSPLSKTPAAPAASQAIQAAQSSRACNRR